MQLVGNQLIGIILLYKFVDSSFRSRQVGGAGPALGWQTSRSAFLWESGRWRREAFGDRKKGWRQKVGRRWRTLAEKEETKRLLLEQKKKRDWQRHYFPRAV